MAHLEARDRFFTSDHLCVLCLCSAECLLLLLEEEMRLVWIQASEVSPYWHVETQVSGRAQTTLSKSQQLKVGSTLAFCKVACKDSKHQKLPEPYFPVRRILGTFWCIE